MQNIIDYVQQLELQGPTTAFEVLKDATPVIAKKNEEQAFVTAKTLVSFASAVSIENRQDILDSILLAQLAANKAFPEEADIIQWYERFIEVLLTIGWVVEEKDFQTFKAKHDVFEVEEAIIGILTMAFGSSIVPIVLQTLKAIKQLANNKKKIIAFEKNTHSQQKGAFQIAHAAEEANIVALRVGTFLISSSKQIVQILFFTSKKDETRLDYYSKKMTLNKETYGKIRATVAKKIEDKVIDFVAEIEL